MIFLLQYRHKLAIICILVLDKLSLEIFNIHGQLIRKYDAVQTHEKLIERGNLKQGVYLIKLKSKNHTETIKFLVQ